MRHATFLVSFFAANACVARTPVAAVTEEASAWFARLRPVLDPLVPPVPITPDPTPAFPMLGELAQAERWEGCGTCHSDTCSCFATHARAVFPGEGGFEEVRLVAHDGGECEWALVAKAREGWIAPIWLGASPAGCLQVVDPDSVLSNPWWYPLGFTQDPSNPWSVRIEGEGNLGQDLYQGGPEKLAARRIQRRVILCRVEARIIACSTRQTLARAVTTTMLAPLPAALTEPLVPDATFTPFAEAAHIGRDWETEWRVRPGADPERALHAFGSGVFQRVPFRAGQDVAVASGER